MSCLPTTFSECFDTTGSLDIVLYLFGSDGSRLLFFKSIWTKACLNWVRAQPDLRDVLIIETRLGPVAPCPFLNKGCRLQGLRRAPHWPPDQWGLAVRLEKKSQKWMSEVRVWTVTSGSERWDDASPDISNLFQREVKRVIAVFIWKEQEHQVEEGLLYYKLYQIRLYGLHLLGWIRFAKYDTLTSLTMWVNWIIRSL